MIRDFEHAAGTLLAGDGTSSPELAARAGRACDELTRHLSRLLGDSGVRLMLKRSVLGAGHQFPWLAGVSTTDRTSSSLRDTMAHQSPEAIEAAFVAILSGFVALLERLIGEGLVERLLDEVWPGVFMHAAKDTL